MNKAKKQLKQDFIKNFSGAYGYIESELFYQINTIIFDTKKAKRLSKVEFYDKTRWLKKESRDVFVSYLIEQEGMKVKKDRRINECKKTKTLKGRIFSSRPTTFYFF